MGPKNLFEGTDSFEKLVCGTLFALVTLIFLRMTLVFDKLSTHKQVKKS